MRPNRKIRIGLAILAFGLLLWGLYSMVSRFRGTPQPEVNLADNPTTNTVPVADTGGDRIVFLRADDNPGDEVRIIPARTILTPDMVEVRRADVGDTDRFVTDIESGASGFITRRDLPFGSQLSKADLVGHISEVGVAGALLPGQRAMVVPIVNKSTLHDLVRVGDRVDIVAAFDQVESRTVVQDVRVLAVDVFGKDYPQVKVAMRGDYKAPPRNIGMANPASPANGGQSGAENGGEAGAAGNAAPNGQQAPEAAPTPVPSPPAKPDPAITVEVTPEQATAISLTQASGQNLDFLIRPRSEPRIAPGTTTDAAGVLTATGTATGEAQVRVASTTRNRLAPYATRVKQGNQTTQTRQTSSGGGSGSPSRSFSGGGGNRNFMTPPIPSPGSGGMQVLPAPVPQPRVVETYDIPVIGDGKIMRIETVKKPMD